MKSHLRRYTSLGDIHKADDDGCITNGRLEFHTNERVLYVDKEPVRLTATETKIMELDEISGTRFPGGGNLRACLE